MRQIFAQQLSSKVNSGTFVLSICTSHASTKKFAQLIVTFSPHNFSVCEKCGDCWIASLESR